MILKTFIIGLLCLSCKVYAQDGNPTALKIGDQLPNITINNIINYKGADGKTAPTAKISDFKGKLLILDFWATWCSPCVAMIPKMDSLQKEFAGKVQFLPVAYQSQKEIQLFLDKLQEQQHKIYDLPDVVGDTILKSLFPHNYLPHYVWIDTQGKILAITEFDQVNRNTIKSLLKNESLSINQKVDVPLLQYDYNKPLLINNNGGDGKNLLYHSVLTSYTPGLNCGLVIQTDTATGKKITCENLCIYQLFTLAYSDSGRVFNELNTKFQVKDTTKIINAKDYGQKFLDWLSQGNGFCYELKVPKTLMKNSLKMMQQDLDRYFIHYQAKINKEKKECLILVKTPNTDLSKSKGGKPSISFDRFKWNVTNSTTSLFVERLNYMQVLKFPVIDETNIHQPVDLAIAIGPTIKGNPDLNSINRELEKYNLKLLQEERSVDQLIISDR